MLLWYAQPAPLDHWREALPIGNGRMGAMIFGGTGTERIQMNEDTIWSGSPQDRKNPAAGAAFPEVRRLMLAGKIPEAEALAAKSFNAIPPDLPNYEPLGDLTLHFAQTAAATNYRRQLDLDSGINTTSYRIGDVTYQREVFASAVDHLLVIRLTADKPHSISFTADLSRPADAVTESIPAGLVLRNSPDRKGSIQFRAELHTSIAGGSADSANGVLTIQNADSVTLMIAAATSFETPDIARACGDTLAAASTDYAALRTRQITDQEKYFQRVTLQLGPANDPLASLPTDQRLKRVAAGNVDLGLEILYFQYGRYLLMASSRPDALVPANLQGIWNEKMRPPWGSMFTININTEMNYWLGEVANLPEMQAPLFTLIDRMRAPGEDVAKNYYGAAGFVAHHNTDLWGDAVPMGGLTGIWPMSPAWLSTNLWQHYAFSGEKQFLADQAYPVMREAAEFLLSDLTDDGHGYLVTGPSVSPENHYKLPDGSKHILSMSPTMDVEITRSLFTHLIAASDILQRDPAFRDRLADALKRLPPFKTGQYGQLLEWQQDYAETEIGHRHISHLWALYPDDQIDIHRTPALAAAARASLERRLSHGGGNTGWSRAWVLNYWARLEEGDQAHDSLLVLLRNSTFPNLFDDHPVDTFILRKGEATEEEGHVFQIDGNFGGAAGIAEMLLQSQGGEISLLPALPHAWSEGEVRGLRARGGCTVDIRWQKGAAVSATLHSTLDGVQRMRVPKSQKIAAIRNRSKALPLHAESDGTVSFMMQKGNTYTISFR